MRLGTILVGFILIGGLALGFLTLPSVPSKNIAEYEPDAWEQCVHLAYDLGIGTVEGCQHLLDE